MIRIRSATARSIPPFGTAERHELHLVGLQVEDSGGRGDVQPPPRLPRICDERLPASAALAAVRTPVDHERVRLDGPGLDVANVVDEQDLSAADLEAMGR